MAQGRLFGRIRRPSQDQIRDLAAMEYIYLKDAEVVELEDVIDEALKVIDRLDELPMPEIAVKYTDRDKGYVPSPEENPYNSFIRKCMIKGAPSGKLSGKTVGLKDNLRVAGVPMTNASTLLHGYVPDVDATVVERLLDAGANIVGKLNMDDFATAGTGETSAYGPPKNPRNADYSAGGSSGGSGAAVAAGEVDIALGVDEGGSGRIPAAWCGVTSIKCTHGLVPSFGLTYMDHTLDFICPTARTVEEVALTLEVIAGDDPKDPQWVRGQIPVEEYTQGLKKDISGLRFGVVRESMSWDVAEEDVTNAVEAGIKKLQSLGASYKEVSVPFWQDSWAIWNGFASHSASAMIESDLEGYWRGGMCDVRWQQAFGHARRVNSSSFPPSLKVWMVMGKYLRREYSNIYFSKAQNLRFAMTQQMDSLFDEVDVLVTPTIPFKAHKLWTTPPTLKEFAPRASSMVQNTAPTNVTGHPSLSVPCGVGDHGLPIGIQFIGKKFDESRLLRVGYAFEQS